LISPQTAYLITHLLKGVVLEGTGARARSLNRPVAGKTGTTNGYFDAWFVGFTPHISTGVWVGYDDQRSLGRLETGNSAALPAWVDYMTAAVDSYPPTDFNVPPGIVFANIDSETGKLATAKSKKAVREAFREGTEPTETTNETPQSEEKNFFKEDLSD
jgi:penicillin-binding protein 1A